MPEEIGQEASFERTSSERAPDTTDDRDLLYLGIDLGTANCSVATSTDVTRTVPSVVGWPKDLIAYKFLQKSIVYGEECIRNRMALDLFYPLEKGVLKYRPSPGPVDDSNREAAAVRELGGAPEREWRVIDGAGPVDAAAVV